MKCIVSNLNCKQERIRIEATWSQPRRRPTEIVLIVPLGIYKSKIKFLCTFFKRMILFQLLLFAVLASVQSSQLAHSQLIGLPSSVQIRQNYAFITTNDTLAALHLATGELGELNPQFWRLNEAWFLNSLAVPFKLSFWFGLCRLWWIWYVDDILRWSWTDSIQIFYFLINQRSPRYLSQLENLDGGILAPYPVSPAQPCPFLAQKMIQFSSQTTKQYTDYLECQERRFGVYQCHCRYKSIRFVLLMFFFIVHLNQNPSSVQHLIRIIIHRCYRSTRPLSPPL